MFWGIGGKYFSTGETNVTNFVIVASEEKQIIYFEYLLIEWYMCVGYEQARITYCLNSRKVRVV